jgi:hypothetical protein
MAKAGFYRINNKTRDFLFGTNHDNFILIAHMAFDGIDMFF